LPINPSAADQFSSYFRAIFVKTLAFIFGRWEEIPSQLGIQLSLFASCEHSPRNPG
jgi:hypothetical protein